MTDTVARGLALRAFGQAQTILDEAEALVTSAEGTLSGVQSGTVAVPWTFSKMPRIHSAAGEVTPINARTPGDGITVAPINIIHDGIAGDIFHLTTGGNTGPGRVVTDLATTNGSPIVTSATGAFSAGTAGVATDLGKTVVATGIPAGATILSIQSATQATLTANASATATGVTATLGSGPAVNTALIAMGVDNGGQGLAIRNKSTGIGLNIQQLSTVSAATSYAMIVTQQSAVAPAAVFQQLGSTQPSLRFTATASRPANTPHFEIYTHEASANLAWTMYADTGKLKGTRSIEIAALNSSTTPQLLLSDEGVANSTDTYLQSKTTTDHGLVMNRFSGSAGLFYSSKLVTATDRVKILVGNGAVAKGSHTYNTGLEIRGTSTVAQMGFFGATVVSKQTVAAAATDLATVITLVNSIRTALINYGLAS